MQAGARYQNHVTAWLAAKTLYIAAESGEAVDDVLAGNDQGSFAFVQAKRRICLSTREGSDLEGVANQAVRQVAATIEPGKRPMVEVSESRLGPAAAGHIIGFSGDNQNASAERLLKAVGFPSDTGSPIRWTSFCLPRNFPNPRRKA
jgi:hypothetical protein